jgi:hypothetical protein
MPVGSFSNHTMLTCANGPGVFLKCVRRRAGPAATTAKIQSVGSSRQEANRARVPALPCHAVASLHLPSSASTRAGWDPMLAPLIFCQP